MKYMLAVTTVLEAEDVTAADVVRARLLGVVRADPAVLVASAPFPVAGRVDGEEAGPKGEEAASPPLPGLAPDELGGNP